MSMLHALKRPHKAVSQGDSVNQEPVEAQTANEAAADNQSANQESGTVQQAKTQTLVRRKKGIMRASTRMAAFSPLSTQVIDTTLGRPAAGVPVEVWVQVTQSNSWVQIAIM